MSERYTIELLILKPETIGGSYYSSDLQGQVSHLSTDPYALNI